jgi:molybdenum cofactor synthesis domain-containing protein
VTPSRLTSDRPIRTAELLAVGSELTTGETRDTNGGELAASLSTAGVGIRRIAALPDDLEAVTAHMREALGAVDLVVSTGGLGPTPDDLTREAFAAALGESPVVDPGLEAWLRTMFERRGTSLLAVNLKQAWLIPSATSIPNANGTAPGWWVDAPDGRIAILLPGPPREMRPMWQEWVLPRLRERGLGDGRVVRNLRTYGIGESMVVDRLGDAWLRRANPVVATYAGADWLDIRVSAVDEVGPDGRPAAAADIVEAAVARIREALPGHVWAEGRTTWAELVTAALETSKANLATIESGTGGQLGLLLADVAGLVEAVSLAEDGHSTALRAGLEATAARVARESGAAVGLALVAHPGPPATSVEVAVVAPADDWSRRLELRLFQHGAHGRLRAAVAAAAFLIEVLREAPVSGTHESRRA